MPSNDQGYIVWEGRSLLDGDPIVVIATGLKNQSKNAKTGGMVQFYVVHRDLSPWKAMISGRDAAICGDCIHRPQKKGSLGSRSCYVDLRYVATVWEAYKRGSYPRLPNPFYDKDHPFWERTVRLTTYGDPAAVPFRVWEEVFFFAAEWTGYTHAWDRDDLDPRMPRHFMASVDTPEEKERAEKKGWRTFRSRLPTEEVADNEAVCPASAEGGKKTLCENCLLCDGKRQNDERRSIVIIAHGSSTSWYTAARSELNLRRQLLLPIVDQ